MSLRIKLLLPLLIILACLPLLIHFFWGEKLIEQKRDSIVQRENNVLRSIGPVVGYMMMSNDLAAMYSTLDVILQKNRGDGWLSLLFENMQGERLYPVLASTDPAGNSRDGTVVIERPVYFNDKPIGRLTLTIDIKPQIDVARTHARELVVITVALFTLVMAVSSLLQSRMVSFPLRRLTSAATQLAEGEFDTPLPSRSGDEIGQLSQAFHMMRENIVHDMALRADAEERLRRAHAELELRVEERTRQLQRVNESLNDEVEKHRLAREGLRLSASVFAHTDEAIIITDERSVIIDVNPAFTKVTGYKREEVVGNKPNTFKSGMHDIDFYKAMWAEIERSGGWSGEIWDRRKNGEVYPKRLIINAVEREDGVVSHYVGIFSDISDAKETERKLVQLAYHDSLTGLPNRALFAEQLAHEFAVAHRAQLKVGLLFIDLDGFKNVNDSLGHGAGDVLLCRVAELIVSNVREDDTVARIGGDEFAVIIGRVENENDLRIIATKLLERLGEPLVIEANAVYIGASIGISIYPDDGMDTENLITKADTAMYRAKENGKGRFVFFHPSMQSLAERKLILETNFRQAMINEEFVLHYQPKIDLKTEKIVGMEALIRWDSGEDRVFSPAEFIPFAEETGLIVPLGRWILSVACKEATRWHALGCPDVHVAVNISAVQFEQEDLVSLVETALHDSGLPPGGLEMEITETSVLNNLDAVVEILSDLNEMGVGISMDDFGTGYSSLNYLHKLPVQTIKVDKSFISELDLESDNAIVPAIINMGKGLGAKVLAEGIETERQRALLQAWGCDEGQGYLFGRPLSIEETLELLRSSTC